MAVEREILNWIVNVPASNNNFKIQLKKANLETCREALKNNCISKGARKAIEVQVRRLKK